MSKLERIAHMVGRGVYHDIREGFGGSCVPGDVDADIKFGVGVVQSQCGVVAAMALVTRYASTIMYEDALARAYVADPANATHGAPVHRVAALLAARQCAGVTLGRSDYLRWGWVTACNYRVVEVAVRNAGAWLDEWVAAARPVFLCAISDEITERERKEVA